MPQTKLDQNVKICISRNPWESIQLVSLTIKNTRVYSHISIKI